MPARMVGIFSWATYTRRPGDDTRTRPEIICSLPGPYLRYTRSVPCFLSSSSTRKFLMNPSVLRISATRTLSFEDGMSTFSCSARLALRMRVSMSAIGSLLMAASPARLDHAGHLALEGVLPEAQAAHLELPEIAARTPAQLAAVIRARGELLRPLGLHDQRGLGHARLLPEGHAQVREERLGFLVGPGRGDDDDVHAAHLVDLVVDDLRENELLAQTEGVVAAAIEGLRRYALEVAHARQGDVDQPVEELVHARPAERHLGADGHVLAELEVGDRLAGAGHDRLLARDRLQVGGREVHHLGVVARVAQAHVA